MFGARKAVVAKQGKMYRLDRHPMEMLLAYMRECHSKQEGHSEPDQRGEFCTSEARVSVTKTIILFYQYLLKISVASTRLITA